MVHVEDFLRGLYERIGGEETCRRLVAAFYARVARDPVLRPVYHIGRPPAYEVTEGRDDRVCRAVTESLTRFLDRFLGGSCDSSSGRFTPSLSEAHAAFRVGRKEQAAWLRDMEAALDDVGIQEPDRSALRRFFAESSRFMINHPEPEEQVSDPFVAQRVDSQGGGASADADRELAGRWARQRAVEAIVHAARQGDAGRALALIALPEVEAHLAQNRTTMLGLLAVLGLNGSPDLFDYVRRRLEDDPALARERHACGRTLLHDAAGGWHPELITLLLRLGADANARDDFGHTPLYCAGNAVLEVEGMGRGGEAVRALVKGGADVNARDGVKRCTALHVAARRGRVEVAEALVACGADLEVRDSAGDTPLRRAVNCGKPGVAVFLLSKGADLRSKGSRGLTPWRAARGAAMKKVLQPFAGTDSQGGS
jgi:truncated hemoglobin YjbI